MNLTLLYSQRVLMSEVEEKIERSLSSISVNKLRGFYSINLRLDAPENAIEAEEFLHRGLNSLVEDRFVY